MNNRLILNILRFIGLLLLQVLIIDHIRLGYYIHPCIYVLFIMLLPLNIPRWQLLLAGFGMGLAVDLFSGTPGLNAAATVFMAFLRPSIIQVTTRRKEIDKLQEPNIFTMGFSWFLTYSICLLILHNLVLFLLEAFSFKLIGVVILQVITSVLISELIIVLLVTLFKSNTKRS